MVKMAARVLKIGMHLRFCPNFTVEFEYFGRPNVYCINIKKKQTCENGCSFPWCVSGEYSAKTDDNKMHSSDNVESRTNFDDSIV